MKTYVKISFISIFSLFLCFSDTILSDALILPESQFQTQQMMTSQFRSHIEHLIRTYYTGWPKKSKPPPIVQKNRIKDCQRD